MISSVKIKLWLMLLHGLILVGAGHGITVFPPGHLRMGSYIGGVVALGECIYCK